MAYIALKRLDKGGRICIIESENSEYYKNVQLIEDELKQRNINFSILKPNQSICKYILKIALARLIIIDQSNYYLSHVKLSKETRVLQLWHGGGLLKKIGYDKNNKTEEELKRLNRVYGNITDVIVCDQRLKKYYASAFNVPIDHIYATGIPRTDLFYKINEDDKLAIRKKLGLQDKKIILIALSYKEEGKKRKSRDINIEKLQKLCGEEFKVIIRNHPTLKIGGLFDRVDQSHLLSITDFLVTDTSSILFDFSFFRKPIILFKTKELDVDKYYVEFNKLGNIAENEEEIVKLIKENINYNDNDIWQQFMGDCRGNSTQNVVNLINVLRGTE